ncbi:NLE (NUC135) domain/WD domain, G-beta repeat, putative [Trypanosoma equiperdum]|uniref:NLE domain-containing protein n=2 Tax=Trypanozoon TaxID=39700 RepID=Q583H9_TRYB2|nr:hypothetical protein, conserved [Trypanosoma brucei brucei TREU927]AAX80198.1 hypothetical protein, conserved [Trypanosoma brucei]AAZ10976.1 hypothetical protein, conserved [Trypanosoma brucei brucei TREU927]SCU71528.1 NLE (NUC135) domain/WD domain, G-beta repeat, putative [Trypanosoma equiperdum]
MQEEAISSAATGVGHVMVTFFTDSYAKAMPEESYAVPLNVLPEGLNVLVQSVLSVNDQVFDFLYNGEYITTTLQKFLSRRGVSTEELVNVEYTPALQAKESSHLPHDDWVSSVRVPFVGHSELLLTGSYDRCIRLWDADDCVAIGAHHDECVKEVVVHPMKPRSTATNTTRDSVKKRARSSLLEDFYCVSCSKDGRAAAWVFNATASKFQLLSSVKAHTDAIESIDISPGAGKYVATASWDCTVKVFEWSQVVDGATEPSAKEPLVSFTDHTRPALSCRFSAAKGAALLYSSGLDGTLKCMDVETAVLQKQYIGDHPVQGLAVRTVGGGGGGDLIIAACTDNRARLYDTRVGESTGSVKVFSGHKQWLYAASWLWRPDEGEVNGGNFFATASEDSTVRLWDLRCGTNALLTLDTSHTDGVLDVTYSGNGEIVSCGKDNSTKSFQCFKGDSLLN